MRLMHTLLCAGNLHCVCYIPLCMAAVRMYKVKYIPAVCTKKQVSTFTCSGSTESVYHTASTKSYVDYWFWFNYKSSYAQERHYSTVLPRITNLHDHTHIPKDYLTYTITHTRIANCKLWPEICCGKWSRYVVPPWGPVGGKTYWLHLPQQGRGMVCWCHSIANTTTPKVGIQQLVT